MLLDEFFALRKANREEREKQPLYLQPVIAQ